MDELPYITLWIEEPRRPLPVPVRCPVCHGERRVPPGPLRLMLGRQWVRCPLCDPPVGIRVYQRLRLYYVRGWLWRLWTFARSSRSPH